MALRVEDIDLAADRELVERWQAGEQAAFDQLYRRYFDRLRGHCYRRVGDRHAAEEIAQEAFVKALQALPRFGGERRFYPWVSVIANRLCIDHHRRLGRVRPSDEVDPGSVDGDHGTRLAFLADVDNLDRALQRLGRRHVQVLELRERSGMSYAEIAEHLAVPQSTVEALLFRARKALRREFMAVSGEGRLASIPLLGVVLRRLTTMRDRVADKLADAGPALSQLASPLAAGAVAAVLAAAPFGSAPPARATVAPASAAPLHSVTTSAPTVRPAAAAPAPSSGGHRPTSDSALSPPLPVDPVDTMGHEAAREEAADMPVLVDLTDIGAGVDLDEVQKWLPGNEEDR